MPFLKVCGRRWLISSDDITVPSSFLLATHLTCLVSVIILLTLLALDDSVPNEAYGVFASLDISSICLTPLILVQFGILVLCSSFELALIILSNRGSIFDPLPREPLNNLLIARFGIGMFELFWILLAIIWSRFCFDHCKSDVFRGIIVINIICEGCTVISLVALLLLAHDPAGHLWIRMHEEARLAIAQQQATKESGVELGIVSADEIVPLTSDETAREAGALSRRASLHSNRRETGQFSSHKKHSSLKIAEMHYTSTWLRSFNKCFCCFCARKPKDSNSIFGAVAEVLSEQFAYLDLTSTDYVAALILLGQVQRRYFKASSNRKFLSGVELTNELTILDQKKDFAELQELTTVLRLAMASGGWKTYSYENTCFSVGWTWSQYNCATCELVHPADDLECNDTTHICNDQIVRNDDGRFLNYASVLKMSGLKPHDIVYCNFRSAVYQTAFIVVVCPSLRKVVISIRGTMSLEDVFTDLNVETTEIPLEENISDQHSRKSDWRGHKGIVQAALYVKIHLIKGRLLERAFHVAEDHYKNLGEFELLLTGHSLGAGTAAILGILLKPQFPNLTVVSFSPPGGLLTLPAAEYTDSFTRTVILGKDVIPRMGKRQLEYLRQDMLNLLELFNKPKWNYISAVTCSSFCCSCCCDAQLEKFIEEEVSFDELQRLRHLARVKQHPLDARPFKPHIEQLYLPGRITHILRGHSSNPTTEDCGEDSVKIVKNGLTRFHYDDVLVSAHMLSDHFNSEMYSVLDQFVNKKEL